MNKPIIIVDARMGRGKSTAAMRYMNENKSTQKFLYITPFLTEVDRVCEVCGFNEPDITEESASKLSDLKKYLRRGVNVATTHSLFYLLDDEALELIREKGYTLIADESITGIEPILIQKPDFEWLTTQCDFEEGTGKAIWKSTEKQGLLAGLKTMADKGELYKVDGALIRTFSPETIKSFSSVFILTYMFEGQVLKAYLELFNFEYKVVGIEQDEHGFFFSDKPDDPPPVDYFELIRVIDNPKLNMLGESRHALSKSWYARRAYDDPDMKKLRNNMYNFFNNITKSGKGDRLWTCFKEQKPKLIRAKGEYRNDFLALNARATNNYRGVTNLAYMVNRIPNPNLVKFLCQNGIILDQRKFALSEMLQWIWRSAIRDENPVTVYIPSRRMRKLLTSWMRTMRKPKKERLNGCC